MNRISPSQFERSTYGVVVIVIIDLITYSHKCFSQVVSKSIAYYILLIATNYLRGLGKHQSTFDNSLGPFHSGSLNSARRKKRNNISMIDACI